VQPAFSSQANSSCPAIIGRWVSSNPHSRICDISCRLLQSRTGWVSEVHRLQRVMNSAARVVSNTRKFDSGLSRLLRDELHWLDVTDRVRFKLGVLMYRSLHGMAPPYLVSGEQLHTNRRRWWSSASAVRKSAEVDRSALSSEQFRSSVFCYCGLIDVEFATWQSSRPSTESQHV